MHHLSLLSWIMIPTFSVRNHCFASYQDGSISVPCHLDAVSHGEMWFLNMGSLKAAQSSAIAWTDVGATPYGGNYNPVMALAQNHIYFLDVPNVPAGSADIFVIHCMLTAAKGYVRCTNYYLGH
jgi:hypothetical protein